jgi:hypothetical protein
MGAGEIAGGNRLDAFGTSDTLASGKGRSDNGEGHTGQTIIQGTINACHLALLLVDPFQDGPNSIHRPGGDNTGGQVHMDFPRFARSARAELAHATSPIRSDPRDGISSKAGLIQGPIATEEGHDLFGLAGWDCEGEPIDREGEGVSDEDSIDSMELL